MLCARAVPGAHEAGECDNGEDEDWATRVRAEAACCNECENMGGEDGGESEVGVSARENGRIISGLVRVGEGSGNGSASASRGPWWLMVSGPIAEHYRA